MTDKELQERMLELDKEWKFYMRKKLGMNCQDPWQQQETFNEFMISKLVELEFGSR